MAHPRLMDGNGGVSEITSDVYLTILLTQPYISMQTARKSVLEVSTCALRMRKNITSDLYIYFTFFMM